MTQQSTISSSSPLDVKPSFPKDLMDCIERSDFKTFKNLVATKSLADLNAVHDLHHFTIVEVAYKYFYESGYTEDRCAM